MRAFVNVCVHVSVCGCVRGREGKLGEVPHHLQQAVSYENALNGPVMGVGVVFVRKSASDV